MTSQALDLAAVMARLDIVLESLSKLEFQVDGLLNSQTVFPNRFEPFTSFKHPALPVVYE